MALCPKCGDAYDGISYHWQHNPSHIPNISNELMEVSKGLVLNADGHRNSAWWNVNKSDKLFRFMGEPVPGFKYKWPDEVTH